MDAIGDFEIWLGENRDDSMRLRDWWSRLAESGWAMPHWPEKWHGRGTTLGEARQVQQLLRSEGLPGAPAGLGTMLAGPTILAHGSDEQKARLLPAIVTGVEAWCQLFSEPEAGSDLSSLRTRAVNDGSVWRVSGHKVWTSNGHLADKGMLLARTDLGKAGREGITWFVIDMHQQGIEVRPLREMTGRSLFTEVFIDDAIVEPRDVVGGVDDGWRVARTTLANERSGLSEGAVGIIPGPAGGWLDRPVGDLVEHLQRPRRTSGTSIAMRGRCYAVLRAAAQQTGAINDPLVRQQLATLFTLEQVASAARTRAADRAEPQYAAAAGSIGKLLHARLVRCARDLAGQILGVHAVAETPPDLPHLDVLQELVLFAPAVSIYGGTDEIQRNIIAERVLGLPRA